MATFSKFYLDQDGVKALIAKIANLYKLNKDAIAANKTLSETEVQTLAAKAGITLTLNADGKTYTAAFADGSNKTLKDLVDDLRTDLGQKDDAASATGSAFARIAANKDDITANKANIATNEGKIAALDTRVTTAEGKIDDLRTDLGQKNDAANADGSAFARIAANKADAVALGARVTTAEGKVSDLEAKAFETVDLTDQNTTMWKLSFKNKAGVEVGAASLDMSKFAIDGMLESASLVHFEDKGSAQANVGETGDAGTYLKLTFHVIDEKGIGDTGTAPQDIYVPLKALIFDQHYKVVNPNDKYASLAVVQEEVHAKDGDFKGESDHIDVTHTLTVSDGLKKAVDAVYGDVDVTDPTAAKDGSIEKRLQNAYTTLYAGQTVPTDESKADAAALVKRVYDVEHWITNNALSVEAGTDAAGKDYEGLSRYFDAVVDRTVNGEQTNDAQNMKKGQWLPGISNLD